MVLPRFLAELKHRKVYRAAVVYAAVGWMLLEAADVVLPRLGLPDWTVNVVLAIVLLCFPLALVFAWIFDLSPQGIVRTEPLSHAHHDHRLTTTAIVEFVLILALVIAVGGLYVDRLSLQKRLEEAESVAHGKLSADQPAIPNPEQYRAIAVLPFADMSEAGDQAWFAEGVAEELLIALSQVKPLSVMARTSSFAFKGTDKTVAEIAEVLGVQAVLEGSVRRSDDRVRITAQLVDAKSGYHIWSGSYQRELEDLFQLQNEIAGAIVQALRVELGVNASKQLIAQQTTRPEAYNAFIRGRALLDYASPESLNISISFFEKAVAADPNYIQAWGYLALANAFTSLWRATEEAAGPTIEAYDRALALNADQSEALAAKALLTQLLHRDWALAGELYQRALLAEDNANAMVTYGIFYLANIEEIPLAKELFEEAERQDPLHAGYKSNLAMLYIWSGDAGLAIKKAREALALNPRHLFALMALLEAYTHDGNCHEALTFFGTLPRRLQEAPRVKGRAGVCHARQGDLAKAEEIYRQLRIDTPSDYAIMQAAALAAELGDVEAAIDILEHEVNIHSWNQLFIRTYFRHKEDFANDPRYLALLRRVHLDDQSIAELHRQMAFE